MPNFNPENKLEFVISLDKYICTRKSVGHHGGVSGSALAWGACKSC